MIHFSPKQWFSILDISRMYKELVESSISFYQARLSHIICMNEKNDSNAYGAEVKLFPLDRLREALSACAGHLAFLISKLVLPLHSADELASLSLPETEELPLSEFRGVFAAMTRCYKMWKVLLRFLFSTAPQNQATKSRTVTIITPLQVQRVIRTCSKEGMHQLSVHKRANCLSF